MRKFYLLIGLCCLISYRALPQQGNVYASHKQTPDVSTSLDTYPLKNGLNQLEKKFDVSIAYKDEWVDGKVIQRSDEEFTTVEQALDELLRETDLYYEKAGVGYYVISQKSLRKSGGNQSASLLAIPALADDFASSAPAIVFEDKPLHVASLDVSDPAIIVNGRVTDENGGGFPGVNVLVKGTTTGTSTDTNGSYSLTVPDENAVLVFSFIGYTSQEVSVGSRTSVDITLRPDVKALEEVVVTALGIERSTKGLGYATSKVTADEISLNRTTNFMNTLTGKIAGVSISALGTGPGGTSKIRIRGQTSINGQNNPLIVINGVPIDNTNFGANPQGPGVTATNTGSSVDGSIQNRGGGATTDGGDGLSSINPDDIESMTVLKGAAAAALYGSRANNGVIMITTKTKGSQKGIGLTYNMNFTDETPLDYTDYQYQYGQGEFGVRPTTPNTQTGQWSFGEKIAPNMTQTLFNTTGIPYEAQKGIINKFYRHGQNMTNTVTLSSSGDKGGLNLSISDMSSQGITPNNTFNRKTMNLGFQYDLSERLSFRGNINYSNEYNHNPPVVAEQDNSIPTSMFAMANTMPLSVLEANKFNAVGAESPWSRFTNRVNPYWALESLNQSIRRDRIFGNVSMKYDLTKWLSVQGRLGEDYWSRDQDLINLPTGKASISTGSINAAVPGFVNGTFTQDVRRFRETNVDFLFTALKDFGDFGLNATFGGNQMRRRSDLNSVQVQDFIVKGLYTVQNGRSKDPQYDLITSGVNSIYGSAEVNYKKWLYLSVTARNDWFSTLSPANRSILYPSVSLGYVFTETMGTKPSWLNFGKFRAAYAEVGSDGSVSPFSNQLFYSVFPNPFNGAPVGQVPGTVPNPNLKPQRTGETELGLEMKMFDNRVNVDLAVYQKITTDQIVNAQISDASGYTSTRINSGKSQNRGIEMMINLVPVRTNNFTWDFTFAGAYNITKVLSLLSDTPGESITVGAHVFNGFLQQIVGQEMGQIVGYGYRRYDPATAAVPGSNAGSAGKIIIGSNGIPMATPTLIPFGSALPKWTGGITNTFSYKGITLSVLIDFKLGGKMLSGTNFNAYRHGLHQATLVGRDNMTSDTGISDPGGWVLNTDAVDINGNQNAKAAKVEDYYSVVRGAGLIEPVVYDAGYWRLRQISVGYDFTKFLPESFPVKGLKLNLVANNVFMIKKWVDNIDPESFGYSSDNIIGMESPGLPTTRSLGFNLNVKF